MKESKSSESQIVAVLKEAAGDEVAGFTERVASKGLAPRVIKAAEPDRSASIERFNRTYRNAVLDAYLFKSIEQVQHMTEEWRLDDNERGPHGALGGLPPRQFTSRITTAVASCAGMST